MTGVLDAALTYAARGWPVFPVDGKVPFVGTHGSTDATTDEATIRAWWEKWPKANVVIMTGEQSGLTVLDVDMHKEDGKATLNALAAPHGPFPMTPMSHTGGGGIHILFAYNAAVKRGPIGKGLEFINWFTGPPSLHESGVRYVWDKRRTLDTPLAPVPEWLVKLAKLERQPTFNSDGHYVLRQGERHDGLLSFAGWLREKRFCEAAIAECLMALNTYHCDPPELEEKIYRMAHDVEKRYQPGKGLPVDMRRKERDERLAGL